MNVSWDPEQRQWLEAMGYTLWALAVPGDAAVAPPVEAARGGSQAAREAAAALFAQDAPPRRTPAATPSAVASAPLRGDRLLRAVLRAAGRRPEDGLDPEIAARVDTARLRGDPSAKRALWPYLRSLRRRGG